MKKIQFFLLAIATSVAMTACTDNAAKANEAEKVAEAASTSATYNVNTGESKLEWHGEKLAYGHSGVISITEGSLSLEGDNISAGNFTVDMKTIEEVGASDEESGAKLVGHLMSPDFFDVETFPTSKFEITGAEIKAAEGATHVVKGNLTIKDKTNNIEFPATIKVDGDKLTADAKFTINRNDWGVTYGSGISGAIGDKVISDNIDYTVSLKANKN
jgi:polyisoprenoid-binding protein YceI